MGSRSLPGVIAEAGKRLTTCDFATLWNKDTCEKGAESGPWLPFQMFRPSNEDTYKIGTLNQGCPYFSGFTDIKNYNKVEKQP